MLILLTAGDGVSVFPKHVFLVQTPQRAELVAVPVPVICEFVWVLRRGYKKRFLKFPVPFVA